MGELLANIDWTQLLVALITLLASVATYFIRKYAVPWLNKQNLTEAAKIAVNAAEACFGRYHGKEKLQMALEIMAETYGFKYETDEVINALKAAWKQLDIQMIAAGAKTEEEKTGEQDAEEVS